MMRLNGPLQVTVVICLLLVLTGCTGAPKGPYCKASVSQPLILPTWVGGAESVDEYYHGVGWADLVQDFFGTQKVLAQKMARDELYDKIGVTVERSLAWMESQERKTNGEMSANPLVIQRLRKASYFVMDWARIRERYVEPTTCRLWVCYKIRRDFADNLIVLKQAEELYQMTLDEKDATLSQKHRWIKDALARLQDVDFMVLPEEVGNENHFTEVFVERKAELERHSVGCAVRTVYLLEGEHK